MEDGRATTSDHMAKIGAVEGQDRDWRTIWEDSANAEIKGKRTNPHMLFKGDQVQVEDGQPAVLGDQIAVPAKEERADSVDTEKINKFERKVPKLELRLRVFDHEYKACKNWKYRLTSPSNPVLTGDINEDGTIEVELESKGTIEGRLSVWEFETEQPDNPSAVIRDKPVVMKLRIGKLNSMLETDLPDEGLTGLQARLHNMGFGLGNIDGKLGDVTKASIKKFQERFAVTPADGEPSEATKTKMDELHDKNTELPDAPEPAKAT